jgi:mono/diheme cytochrome c family protein
MSFHSNVIASARTRHLAMVVCLFFGSASSGEERLTYEEHIRPIFRVHCFDCHGASEEIEGELDLRLVRLMKLGGESGPAILPGSADESLFLQRIRAGEMPPKGEVSEDEIAILERWINAGAITSRAEPDQIASGLGITLEERQFWAFQPIQRPVPPDVAERGTINNPIDAFLLARMPIGLAFSSVADRATLVKRLYLDLWGLPPTPEEMDHWLSEQEGWYERLIDELLASPRYGERWGRHWLDIAGYADSEGYTVADADRPWAWKYRDYVVRAINSDKPIDRFIVEQLAGDDLVGGRSGDLTAEQIELFTATGFLRMAADGTGSGANTPEARNQVVIDTIRIVSSSLLSISMGCAQCHDHRYDPILQSDYYAMRAIFEPALDWQKWQVPSQRRVSLYTVADRKRASEIESEAQKVAAERAAKQAEFMKQALEKELEKYESPLKEALRAAYQTVADKRSDRQKSLLKQYPSVNINPGVLYQYLPKAAEELKSFDTKIADIRAKKPVEEFLRALVEPTGRNVETRLFHRGEYKTPKQIIGPAALTVVSPLGHPQQFALDDTTLPSTGRRLAYARWLTNGTHPLVTRNLVNRFWMHHFGRGIVSTPAEFGKLGTTPSHPDLLDWLASEFTASGWSLKQFHRLILTSAAWRQSARTDSKQLSLDRSNQFYARWSLRRLEAEVVRDRTLAVGGQLDFTIGGPPVGIKSDDSGQVVVNGNSRRRSLYVRVRRSQPVAMLQVFDAPVMEVNCEKRSSSTVATQSLMLMNSQFILDRAADLATAAAAHPVDLDDPLLASLPRLPVVASSAWHYGHGGFDPAKGTRFTPLPHWTESAWQGGPELPDPKLNWVFVNAQGGHTGDGEDLSSIRRFVAPAAGRVTVTGQLSHGSENGDGVQGHVIFGRQVLGKWVAFHGTTETRPAVFDVGAGEAIDFLVDRRNTVTSDSYTWAVKIHWKGADGSELTFDSTSDFRGPNDEVDALPAKMIRVWQLALCRRPSPDELLGVVDFASKQLAYLDGHSDRLPKDVSPMQQVLVNLAQVLMTSNEFLYVD